jgi:uncharacterized membrane protein YphA (DoxX/SURF4 family)
MILIRLARAFFGLGIAGMGAQQFIYSSFRPVFLSWPVSFSNQSTWAYIVGSLLIIAGVFIAFSDKAKSTAFALGILFLSLFVCFHLPQQLRALQHSTSFVFAAILGPWINPLKELALAGGAFIIAVSFAAAGLNGSDKLLLITGRIFFSIMLILFGISHFVYTDFVVTLIPGWLPFALFWTYFAAVALIGAGLFILFGIRVRIVSILLGTMLFLWLLMVHIPRAFKFTDGDKGNELTSVFQALAFSGVAFALACIYRNKISRRIN